MLQKWWVKHENGNVEGPFPTETIRARIYAGFLTEDSLISNDRHIFKPARESLPADEDSPILASAPIPDAELPHVGGRTSRVGDLPVAPVAPPAVKSGSNQCPSCANEVSDEAASCPKCGFFFEPYLTPLVAGGNQPSPAIPAPEPITAAQTILGLGCAVVMLSILGYGGCFTMFSGKPTPEVTTGDKYSAQAYTEEFISRVLKAPSTAQYSNWNVKDSGGGKWTVICDVDSQNSFGAMLRKKFIVTLTITGDNAHMNSINEF
jgi:hypothetical protein